jgi:TetR/AcrR family transcriptional repressor of nem operon
MLLRNSRQCCLSDAVSQKRPIGLFQHLIAQGLSKLRFSFALGENVCGMTKGLDTRQTIIELAAPLFNQRGFAGCSMGDVMEATGLEKGGLYRHFSSKEELATEVLRYSLERSARLRMQALPPGTPALQAIKTYIEHFVVTPSAVPGGCPLLNAAVDADDGNPALRAVVRKHLSGWKKRVRALVERAQAEGDLQADADPEWLADTIIATLEGALMMSRLACTQKPLRHAQRSLGVVLASVTAKG